MKMVRLRFLGLGYLDCYQANIFIYDKDKLIFKRKTFNGKISLSLHEGCAYKLIARLGDNTLCVVFYVGVCNRYTFNFNNNNITLKLMDYYYDNLPIERGEMVLWRRM